MISLMGRDVIQLLLQENTENVDDSEVRSPFFIINGLSFLQTTPIL